MTPQERLETVGKALFGDQWQTDLARALDIQPRTVRYWMQNGSVPHGVWKDVKVLCRDRIPLLIAAMTAIEDMEG